jgi:hypothetical protein
VTILKWPRIDHTFDGPLDIQLVIPNAEAVLQIHLPKCNIGNLMFRYMFARHLQTLVPLGIITGPSLTGWGILLDPQPPKNPITLPAVQHVDVPALLNELAEDPTIDGVICRSYAMRLEYFAGRRGEFGATFRSEAGGQFIGPDEIVVSVRSNEILTGLHPDYNLVPVSYIRRVVAQSGLRPVFSGQTQPNYYTDALRACFPHARFLAGNHWLDDFQTLRNAKNIVLSVSSFAWLAAWFSQTAERIYMPVLGIYNPAQRPDIDLLPLDDLRYVFEEMPVEPFTASDEQIARILA